MAVPYTFGSATTSIPLSQLDSNFATTITLGNTAVQLGNTITNLTGVSNVASATSLSLGSNGNTTAITVDTSQNVGIGTATPNISGQTSAVRTLTIQGSTTWGAVEVATSASDGADVLSGFYGFTFPANSTNYKLPAYIGAWTEGATANQRGANMRFFTQANATAGATERMRIDSSGRLLVGVTSPVGSTFSTIQYDANTYNGLCLNQSTNSSGARFMLFASQGTQCGVIDRVGTTSAVVYGQTSDRRLKENIVDSPSAIEHINAVKVRSFNWKDGGHQVKYGVIAQEFFEVEPDAVVKGDDGETIEKTWSVDSSALVPAMIKAIQEQQALITAQAETINALTARIVALEAK